MRSINGLYNLVLYLMFVVDCGPGNETCIMLKNGWSFSILIMAEKSACFCKSAVYEESKCHTERVCRNFNW